VSGKIIGIIIVAVSLVAGVAIYYLQLYAFYEAAPAETEITVVNLVTEQREPMLMEGFQGIDADSSPLRFRSCFTTSMSQPMLTETFITYDGAAPLTAPGWFDCFNAVEIGEALETGEAIAFLSQKNIHDGVDRVVAVFPDGRAFAWHQLNEKYSE